MNRKSVSTKRQVHKKTKATGFNFISDRKRSSIIWTSVIFFLLSLSIFNLSVFMNSTSSITYAKIDNTAKHAEFWKSFLEIHPDYIEGWIELYKLESKQGNLLLAEEALTNAERLDPNSEEIKLIRGEIIY